MTTNRQKAAVRFCETWLEISFIGDINNFREVSKFLFEHLDNAKSKFVKMRFLLTIVTLIIK